MKIEQYQKGWQKEGFKNRCVKIRLDTHISDDLRQNLLSRINKISYFLWDEIQNGLDISGQRIKNNGKKENKYDLADEIYKKYKDKLDIDYSCWGRTIARPPIERYRAYFQRNSKQTKSFLPFRSDRAIRLGSGIFEFSKGKLFVKRPDEQIKDEISYEILGTMKKYEQYLSPDMGGNLKDNIFIVRAKVPFYWSYQPTTFLGIDINKRKDVFLVDSDSNIEPHSPELVEIISEIKKLNKEIKSKEIKTKQRKRRRLRWKKLHKKMDKLIQSYVFKLIKKTIKNNSCLCIDNITTGTTNGSYGQDKLIPSLIKECENRRIPHVVVPPGYSSRLCSCGTLLPIKARSKDKKDITCENCGTKDADINGAKNIAFFGSYIWQHGLQRFYDWRKGKVDLKKKLVELQT